MTKVIDNLTFKKHKDVHLMSANHSLLMSANHSLLMSAKMMV